MKNRNLFVILASLSFFMTMNAHSYWIYSDVSGQEGEPIEVELVEGWNLISCPYEGWKAPTEFEYWGWDGQNYFNHDKNIPLEAGKGYWLYSYRNTSVTMTGYEGGTAIRAIKRGWNLFGALKRISLEDLSFLHTVYCWNSVYSVVVPSGYLYPGKGYWGFVADDYNSEVLMAVGEVGTDVKNNCINFDITLEGEAPDAVKIYLYDVDNQMEALSVVFVEGDISSEEVISIGEEHGLALLPDNQYMLQVTPIKGDFLLDPVISYFRSGTVIPNIDEVEVDWGRGEISSDFRIEYAAFKMNQAGKVLETYHDIGTYAGGGELVFSETVINNVLIAKVEGDKVVVMVRAIDDDDLPLTPWKTFSSDGLRLINDLRLRYVIVDVSLGTEADSYPFSVHISYDFDEKYSKTHILFTISKTPRITEEGEVNLKFEIGNETYYTVFPITNEQREKVLGKSGSVSEFLNALNKKTKLQFSTFSNVADDLPEVTPPIHGGGSSGDGFAEYGDNDDSEVYGYDGVPPLIGGEDAPDGGGGEYDGGIIISGDLYIDDGTTYKWPDIYDEIDGGAGSVGYWIYISD